MPIYMQIGPADKLGNLDPKRVIMGTSKDTGHVGWIPLQTWDPGTKRSRNPSNNGGRTTPIREAVCTRLVDGTSTTLFRMAFSSTDVMVAIIDFTNESGEVYLELKLSEAVLSDYSTIPGKTPRESININFTNIQILKRAGDDTDQSTGTPDTIGYDLTTAKGI